nr:methyl-CpG-binding domain-containing protein 4-like [Tanacetum cinerariifolium]
MKKPAAAANGSSVVTRKSSAKKSRGPPQNSIDTFAVQCNDCFKWRTIPTEDEFEEYRSKQNEDPFVCTKLEGIVCDSPADIEYDSSRTWVMDKPNIPKTAKGNELVEKKNPGGSVKKVKKA